MKTKNNIVASLLNEHKKFFSTFSTLSTLNVWAVLLIFIPLKNEKNSDKNILRKSWIITMLCTSSSNPLLPLLHISSKNYWALSSLPSLGNVEGKKRLIWKKTSSKLTKRVVLPKFSKIMQFRWKGAILTITKNGILRFEIKTINIKNGAATILKLGVRLICSSFNLCSFLKPIPYWFIFKSHSYKSIKYFQLMSLWSSYSVN